MNGIINVYKEKGYTSHDVIAKLRGICHQKKIGHTGTLDPDAQGVLPVCLGSATKVCGSRPAALRRNRYTGQKRNHPAQFRSNQLRSADPPGYFFIYWKHPAGSANVFGAES